ncbi:MAG TPA: CvpA family protein [Burkholderiaceae bacterium]|nr:CvpA family protein [Burkholderiaceae bacterium]
MTGFDYIVLAILGVSALLGMIRGLVKEVLSLLAFAVAVVAAVWWGGAFATALTDYISNGFLRAALGYGGVFVIVLLLVGLLNLTLSGLIERTGLTPADHGLGAVFGLARGALIIFVLVGLAGHTELPQEPWWREARLAGAVVGAVQQSKSVLPPALSSWLPD